MAAPVVDDPALTQSLSQGLLQQGLSVSASDRDLLLTYLQLLHRWNKTYNLTSVRELALMVPAHLLDSLSVQPYLTGDRILDLGSGGGLPGIPLSVLNPQRQFVLLDSNGKKTRFLRQVVMELGLSNVDVVQSRVEIFHPHTLFDTVISRAYGQLSDILSLTPFLLHSGGRILTMKGRYPTAELKGLSLEPEAIEVIALQVPGLEGERHLIGITVQ